MKIVSLAPEVLVKNKLVPGLYPGASGGPEDKEGNVCKGDKGLLSLEKIRASEALVVTALQRIKLLLKCKHR